MSEETQSSSGSNSLLVYCSSLESPQVVSGVLSYRDLWLPCLVISSISVWRSSFGTCVHRQWMESGFHRKSKTPLNYHFPVIVFALFFFSFFSFLNVWDHQFIILLYLRTHHKILFPFIVVVVFGRLLLLSAEDRVASLHAYAACVDNCVTFVPLLLSTRFPKNPAALHNPVVTYLYPHLHADPPLPPTHKCSFCSPVSNESRSLRLPLLLADKRRAY